MNISQGIVTENSWPVDKIDRNETFEAISETIAPADIVRAVFDIYATQSEQSTHNNILHKYNEEMVCRTIAQNVLQQGTKFHFNDFMETWQNALPDGFHVQVSESNAIEICIGVFFLKCLLLLL